MLPKETVIRAKGWPVVLGLAVVVAAQAGKAASAKKKGEQIVRKTDEFHAGFEDYKVDGVMILRDGSGDSSRRKLELRLREDREDGDDSRMVFSYPSDIDGTALLTDSHKEGDDDQWLYMPAINRIKRIASANQSGPFLGSEFTYEDLIPRVIEKYDHEFLGIKPCRRGKCYVIKAVKKEEGSHYPKQIQWISKKDYLTMRIVFFNREGKKAKTMVSRGYKKYEGEHWAPASVTMKNHINGKSTTFKYSDYEFENGFPDRDFERSAIKGGR